MVKIISLCDNIVDDKKCWAAEGVSLLITVNGVKVLFDTGRTIEVLKHNLGTKKIDPASIDYVILSHGHKGHMGAIVPLLDDLKPTATVVFGAGIEKQKYKIIDGKSSFSTNVNHSEAMEKIMARGRYIVAAEKTDITNEIAVLGSIPVLDEELTAFSDQYMVIDGDKHSADRFSEELAVCIHIDGKLVIISGCSHRGINNIISYAKSFFADHEIHAVIGGFHMKDDSEKTKRLIEYFRGIKPEFIAPCHCTGIYSKAKIRDELFESFRDFSTGIETDLTGRTI